MRSSSGTKYVKCVGGAPQVPDISGSTPPVAGGVLSGQDVISEGLITFGSIQELISINTKLQVSWFHVQWIMCDCVRQNHCEVCKTVFKHKRAAAQAGIDRVGLGSEANSTAFEGWAGGKDAHMSFHTQILSSSTPQDGQHLLVGRICVLASTSLHFVPVSVSRSGTASPIWNNHLSAVCAGCHNIQRMFSCPQIVARQVVAEAEKSKEEIAATYRQRWEAEQAALQAETERLRQVSLVLL